MFPQTKSPMDHFFITIKVKRWFVVFCMTHDLMSSIFALKGFSLLVLSLYSLVISHTEEVILDHISGPIQVRQSEPEIYLSIQFHLT